MLESLIETCGGGGHRLYPSTLQDIVSVIKQATVLYEREEGDGQSSSSGGEGEDGADQDFSYRIVPQMLQTMLVIDRALSQPGGGGAGGAVGGGGSGLVLVGREGSKRRSCVQLAGYMQGARVVQPTIAKSVGTAGGGGGEHGGSNGAGGSALRIFTAEMKDLLIQAGLQGQSQVRLSGLVEGDLL